MWLKLNAKDQYNIKAAMPPEIAPEVSSARWIPKPLPLASGMESAMIASLGAVLKPLPTRSKLVKTNMCCQSVENARSNLKHADVK